MTIYELMVSEINSSIAEVNNILLPTHQIDMLRFSTSEETEDFKVAFNVKWSDLAFPKATSRGVYFLLGRKIDSSIEFGVYIGKASFRRHMGHRLFAHLARYRHEANYQRLDKNGVPYFIDYIGALSLETIHEGFLASSVEEFLIKKMRTKFHLLNKTGNS